MLSKLIAMKNAYIKNEDGATAIEYALMVAGISLVIIGAVYAFGGDLSAMFEGLGDQITTGG